MLNFILRILYVLLARFIPKRIADYTARTDEVRL